MSSQWCRRQDLSSIDGENLRCHKKGDPAAEVTLEKALELTTYAPVKISGVSSPLVTITSTESNKVISNSNDSYNSLFSIIPLPLIIQVFIVDRIIFRSSLTVINYGADQILETVCDGIIILVLKNESAVIQRTVIN